MSALTISCNMQSATSHSSSHILQSTSRVPPVSYAPKSAFFAFARVRDRICLVQTEKPPSSTPLFLTPIDVTFFSHEFGTMFRVSHRSTVSAADIQILASIADEHVLVEDSGVVFVARELTDQLLRWTNSRRVSSSPAPSRLMRRR